MRKDNIASLPNDTHNTPLIRLRPRRKITDPEMVWEETDKIRRGWRPDPESLYIRGTLAQRILALLRYDHDKQPFGDFINDPDCHGAAMYALGMTERVKRLSVPDDLEEIYNELQPTFSTKNPKNPTLVHLLTQDAPSVLAEGFTLRNTPHSAIHLGKIYGHDICYEKRGGSTSRFSALTSAEEHYGTTHRLYVHTGKP